jgi:hypothetical protein
VHSDLLLEKRRFGQDKVISQMMLSTSCGALVCCSGWGLPIIQCTKRSSTACKSSVETPLMWYHGIFIEFTSFRRIKEKRRLLLQVRSKARGVWQLKRIVAFQVQVLLRMMTWCQLRQPKHWRSNRTRKEGTKLIPTLVCGVGWTNYVTVTYILFAERVNNDNGFNISINYRYT